MALRLNSLKTRTALAMSSLIVVILVVNAVYLVLTKRSELRQDIQDRGMLFAALTRQPVCVGFETYYASGFYKFRELMRDYLRLEEDVERILIISVNGKVLFDSAELDTARTQKRPAGPERWITEPDRLEAIKRLEPTQIPGVNASGEETLEIIAPYIEDWGRHRLSVAYHVSYKNLNPKIARLVHATLGLTLASILASMLVALTLASRITRPLETLTQGAQDLAEGHFDRRLSIRSNDELQILAEAFNHMTARLKENVEQLEESNKKLAAVNEELKELDRLKSDLLANVSHELRTPLTAIKGYTDYIREGKLGVVTEKQEKGLTVVQKNLDRLAKSINDLLDFSRMDVGRIALNIQPFDFSQLVDQIVTTVRSELDKRHIGFSKQVEPELPQVIADRDKLSQVVENLVMNAIKFTPEGGRITVSARRSERFGRPAAEIQVADTGIGIPASEIGKVFNRFHQVDGTSTRKFGGVGLGLAIVKSILDAHGTAIAVQSEEGRGTAFRFVLPVLEKVEAGKTGPSRPPEPPAGAEGRLVLLVDDEPDYLDVMMRHLEEQGFGVLTAATAAQGLEMAREHGPDIILLDLLLPDRCGLELLRSLKEDPGTRHIPVLVVSITNDGPKALSLGAAECLSKPVDGSAVVSATRRLLERSATAEPTILVVDDEPDTVSLIQTSLADDGFRTLVARDGRQALELIARRRPDLVVLDIMMPHLSGFEVLEAMGKAESTAAIPVVVLTARQDDADARRGLALGAKRYMSKPFDIRALIAEVRKHLGSRAPAAQNGRTSL